MPLPPGSARRLPPPRRAAPRPPRRVVGEPSRIPGGGLGASFGGGPPPARAGETVNVPANAPHSFRNSSHRAARLLCTCSPSGQEEFFLAVGDRVASRTAP